MAHYAILNSDNIVTQVIVGRDETDTPPTGFSDWEEYYTDFMGSTAKRCSYNTYKGQHQLEGTAFRGNFPGEGDEYYPTEDVFGLPASYQPTGFVMDSNGVWNAPVAMPNDGKPYIWNEGTQQWDLDTSIAEEDLVELPEL